MKQGDKILIAVLLVATIVSSGYVWWSKQNQGEQTAVITIDDQEFQRINLSKVKEPYSFRVEPRPGQYNMVEVEPGRIRVSEANCPNQVDVLQGWISDSTGSIVCVPHGLVIRIEQGSSTNDLDGIVQ